MAWEAAIPPFLPCAMLEYGDCLSRCIWMYIYYKYLYIKKDFNMNMCMMYVSMYGTRTSRIDWKKNHEENNIQTTKKSLNFPNQAKSQVGHVQIIQLSGMDFQNMTNF